MWLDCGCVVSDRRCVKQNINDFYYCDIAMWPSPERIPRPRTALTIDAMLSCICWREVEVWIFLNYLGTESKENSTIYYDVFSLYHCISFYRYPRRSFHRFAWASSSKQNIVWTKRSRNRVNHILESFRATTTYLSCDSTMICRHAPVSSPTTANRQRQPAPSPPGLRKFLD